LIRSYAPTRVAAIHGGRRLPWARRARCITHAIVESLGLKQAAGAIIDEPQPDSPAATAGIKALAATRSQT